LRGQNWATAGLEILIVVVGIFLGFQVDRWYEAAKERKEETQYLERLLADTKANQAEFQRQIDLYTQQIEGILKVDEVILAGELPEADREQFDAGLFAIGSLPTMRLQTGTYRELLAAGRLGLIRDQGIKELLLEQDAVSEFVKTQHRDFRNMILSWIDPVNNQIGLRDNPEGLFPLMVYDFDRMKDDKPFREAMHQSLFIMKIFRSYRLNEAKLNELILARLACKTEKTPCPALPDTRVRSLLISREPAEND